jgi:hypothetical protein
MMSATHVKEKETALSLRVSQEFIEETRSFAGDKGVSQYIREAVQEKNEREMAERMKRLSARLSAKHLAMNREMDGAAGDGLA